MKNASPKQGEAKAASPDMDGGKFYVEFVFIRDFFEEGRTFSSSRKLNRVEEDFGHGNSSAYNSWLDDDQLRPEGTNARAVTVINRVSNKLTGRDFKPNQLLDVKTQVDQLILQATCYENLCQCWVGWCSFW